MATAGQQGAQHQDAGTHLADEVVGGLCGGDLRRLQQQRTPAGAAVNLLDLSAQAFQQVGHGLDVGKARDRIQAQLVTRQQASRHQGQGRVLGAADGDFALQRAAALDFDAVH